MKLSEYAKINGLTYRTAWNHFKKGDIPNAKQLPSGTIVIESLPKSQVKTYIYARDKNSDEEIKRQAKKLRLFCLSKGWDVAEVITEKQSAIADRCPKLETLLEDRSPKRIVIARKDVVARFGFHLIQAANWNCEFVITAEEPKKQFVDADLQDILVDYFKETSGSRGASEKAKKAMKSMEEI